MSLPADILIFAMPVIRHKKGEKDFQGTPLGGRFAPGVRADDLPTGMPLLLDAPSWHPSFFGEQKGRSPSELIEHFWGSDYWVGVHKTLPMSSSLFELTTALERACEHCGGVPYVWELATAQLMLCLGPVHGGTFICHRNAIKATTQNNVAQELMGEGARTVQMHSDSEPGVIVCHGKSSSNREEWRHWRISALPLRGRFAEVEDMSQVVHNQPAINENDLQTMLSISRHQTTKEQRRVAENITLVALGSIHREESYLGQNRRDTISRIGQNTLDHLSQTFESFAGPSFPSEVWQ